MKVKTSLPKKIATVAIWMVAIPTLAIIRAVRGERKPSITAKTAK